MTHRDRVGDPPGRRQAAGDVGHRQGFPTPSGGSPTRPERRRPKVFGGAQHRLHGIQMAEVLQAGAVTLRVVRNRTVIPGEAPLGGFEETGHEAQQARLAAAVRAVED